MRLVDVISGSAFRLMVFLGLLFALILLVAGTSIYQIVRSSTFAKLEVQLVKELSLLRNAYDDGGLNALTSTVSQLEDPIVAGERFVGLFDESGKKLAGNMNITAFPSRLIARDRMTVVSNGMGETLYVRAMFVESKRIVIGRDVQMTHEALTALVSAFITAGVITITGGLMIGWLLSRRFVQQFERITVTLERVAQGDTEVRIPTSNKNSQIDRISRLINESLEKLSALMKSTQNTIYNIAHDLRLPLNRAFILVSEAADSKTNRKQLLTEAQAALYNLGTIFDTVLRISKLETATDQPAFSFLDLNRIIREVVAVFESTFTDRKQTAVIVDTASPVMILADEQMLKLLLTNLLQNFNRYTPEGSTVTLSVCLLDTGESILQVADNGPGIPDWACDDMLKPFYQLDSSRSKGGSGLGLALVRAIAVRHGATLSLANNHPGLRIEVCFPPLPANLSNL